MAEDPHPTGKGLSGGAAAPLWVLVLCAALVALAVTYDRIAQARAVRWQHVEGDRFLDTWQGRLCDPSGCLVLPMNARLLAATGR